MMSKLKIFIIAGEASGDILGAKLMTEIKNQYQGQVSFVGIGGLEMEKQGLKSIFNMDELSIMGFFEVIPHIFHILKRIKQTAFYIKKSQADAVITIDSPDFCFRVIKKLNKICDRNIKKIHLIAPSVWAYRENRAKKISKIYDLLLAILPFEPPYFTRYGLKTVFIGHPIVENNFLKKSISKEFSFRKKHNIKEDEILICAMAGSRISEVKKILPEIIGSIKILINDYPNLKIAMPVISKTENIIKEQIRNLDCKIILVKDDEKYQLFQEANLAIAKSGTNNLEIALYSVPIITIYKVNFLTYFIAKAMIKIKFANLINILLNEEIVPELIQNNCNAKEIARISKELISNHTFRQNQIDNSKIALKMLGSKNKKSSSQKAAEEVLKLIKKL